jgi:PAS domain S-box-containing protein
MANDDELSRARTVPDNVRTSGGIPSNDQGLLDAVDLPTIVIRRDCTVARFNRAATTLLGLTASDLGCPVSKLVAGDANLDKLCAQVIADGVAFRREVRDGDRTFLLRVARYTGDASQIAGAVVTFTNVTAFRASIDQAIYEREYTKAILNTVIDPMVVLNAKLQVQTANRAFYAMFGLSRDGTQGISIRKLGDQEWETFPAWNAIETTLVENTQFQAIEIEREFPGTGRRTVALDARRLERSGDGDALILLTFQDVTERKRAERANSLLAAIVGSSDDAMVSKTLSGTITSWNKSAERLFGYTAEEAVGQSITLIIPWERRSEEEEILRRLARGERVEHFETVRRRKDGTVLDVSLTISPIRDASGKVIGASKVARDISEGKRIERALRESEERFRALVIASSYAAYRMNPDWSEMRELDGSGFVADTAKPRKDWVDDYIHPDDQERVLQAIGEAVRTKSLFRLEHRVRRADGSVGWTYSRAIPILDANGEIVEWFGAASDVTDRKEAEENYRLLAQTLELEVRARTRELEERNADVLRQSEQVRALSWRLLRSQDEERRHIARELHDSAGQTLTVLGISLAQIIQKAGRRAPEVAAEVEQIQDTVQQLHREIRTTSYLLHPPLLDENGLHSAISWYLQGLLERSGLDVRIDISEQFGRLPHDMELVIFRLVQECLTNIHRHSESKTASIRMAQESNRITLEIRDQGKGMSPTRLAEIQSGRSGLGIRGMRERLRQFEGTMYIESGSSGTRILVTIPIANVALPQDQSTVVAAQVSPIPSAN